MCLSPRREIKRIRSNPNLLLASELFMWRREGGKLGCRPLDDSAGRIIESSELPNQTFTLLEPAVCLQDSEPSPRSPFRHHHQGQPSNHKRINTSSSSNTTDSQWHSTSIHQQSLRLRNIGPPRRCESSELADSPVRTEAIKLVRGLNRAVASHVTLAALLGGSGDGPNLRDELRRARRTAQEVAAKVRAILLPSLLDQRWAEKERMELERLWHLLLCCLDSLEISMQRSLVLLRDFSLADGRNILIHTGLEVPNHHHHHYYHHHHHSLRQNQSTSRGGGAGTDDPIKDKIAMEGVESSQLCKELFELRIQLQELKSAVEIRSLSPAAFEDVSPSNQEKPRRIDTLLSINGTDMLNLGGNSVSCSIPSDETESIDSELGSQAEAVTGAQRRCICWILTIMISAFVIAMLIGVFVALFS